MEIYVEKSSCHGIFIDHDLLHFFEFDIGSGFKFG